MKIFKFLIIVFGLSVLIASCGKESIVEVEDIIPTVDPTTEVVKDDGSISLAGIVLSTDTAGVLSIQPFGNDSIYGYGLHVESTLLGGAPGDFFSMNWMVAEPELTIQEGSYTGQSAISLDLATIQAVNDWLLDGADTTNLPNIANTQYDATGVTIDVSNVNLEVQSETIDSFPDPNNPGQFLTLTGYIDEADIEINGNLVDVNNNSIPVSGSFFARIKRIDF